MTLDELLDCSAAELAAMDEPTLKLHFEKYFNVTRPELAPRPSTKESSSLISPEAQNLMKLKVAKLKALGIEVDIKDLLKKKKSL
jgi:hypothetical protein